MNKIKFSSQLAKMFYVKHYRSYNVLWVLRHPFIYKEILKVKKRFHVCNDDCLCCQYANSCFENFDYIDIDYYRKDK